MTNFQKIELTQKYEFSNLSFSISEKLSNSLRLESLDTEDYGEVLHVRLIDRSYIKILSNRVKELLVDHKDAKMPLDSFLEQFREIYSDDLDVQQLQSDLKDLIVIQENSIGNAKHFYTLNSTDYFSFF